ncbi:MAG: peptidoglycan DD-metalloendopeptidase family protein [Candidatus Moranbacteria bacterium]|nr:peptidoglycan DD-metalloendopeptidase family protein [Candidatus Moranbacteria bacterium]
MTIKNGKKYFLLFFVLGTVISGGLFASSVYGADTTEEYTDDLKDDLKEINAKIKAYKQIVDLKEKQSDTLESQLSTLETQAQKLEREIRENEQELSDLGRELRETEAGISEKERFIVREKQVLSGLIREYHAATVDGADVLFALGDGNGILMKRQDWVTETSGRIGAMLRSLEETKQALLSGKETLDRKKLEADTVQEQLDRRNEYLIGSRQSKATLLAKTEAEKQKYSTLVRTLQEEQKDIENEINNLESGKIGVLDLGKIPKYQKGLLSYPVKKIVITQGYGMTSYAKSGAYGGGPHNGVDFGASTGTSVYAAMKGKVVAIGSMTKNGKWYGYGRWIAIDHGNGLLTLYGHLSKQSVKKGEKVDEGEQIGLSGNTGYSTGPHLHFSVFSSDSFEVVPSSKVSGISVPIGAHVNPMKYLP